MTRNIVIVGLSFSGISVVDLLNKQSLPEDVRIIGIDRNSFGFFPPASIRASVVKGFESSTVQTFDNVFPQGSKHRIITENPVVEVGQDFVTLAHPEEEFGTQVPFYKLVVATGSQQSFPARPRDKATIEEVKNEFIQTQKQIENAQDVLVVGGGASGVEFIGEIAEVYPEKNITLVHSSDQLVGKKWSKKLSDTLLRFMYQKNINVILNDKVDLGENIHTGPLPEKKSFVTQGGQTLQADYVFVGTGNKINSQILEKLVPSAIDENTKSVKVTEELHLEANKNIFVVGDISAIDFPKMAAMVEAQSNAIVHNILHPDNYTPMKPPPIIGIIVTFGPSQGGAQVNSWVFGSWLARLVKGDIKGLTDKLFISKYNYKPPKKSWFSWLF